MTNGIQALSLFVRDAQGIASVGRGTFILVLLALAAYDVGDIVLRFSAWPQPPFNDFFGLWSFGTFAAAAGSKIYDPGALWVFQLSLDPGASPGAYPYPYPPTFLLLLIPLGWMPIVSAYISWIVAIFLFYEVITFGWDFRSLYGAALLVAPTTLLTIISGQNGFLSAALLIGGLRYLARAPVMSGILLGLLTYKPQLGLLVPVALVAAKEWRVFVMACVTTVVTIIGSAAVLGGSIWLAWLQSMPLCWALLKENQTSLDHLMPTVTASLHEIGAPGLVGYLAQFALMVLVVIALWRALAASAGDRAVAMAAIGAILVTPYAFIYDMPMITAALALEWRRRKSTNALIKIWEIVVVGSMFEATVWMTTATLPFVVPALLFVIFSAISGANNAWRTTAGGESAETSVKAPVTAATGNHFVNRDKPIVAP